MSGVAPEFLEVAPANSGIFSDWESGWGTQFTVLDTVNPGGVVKIREVVRWIGISPGCWETSSDVGK